MKLYNTLVILCLLLVLGLFCFPLCQPEPETITEADATKEEAVEPAATPTPTATPDPTEAPTPTPTEPPAAPEVTTEPEEPEEVRTLDPVEVELIGRTIWGEADGVKSKAERAAVAWCILNRVDSRGQTIEEVVTAPEQFHGYRPADKWGECPQRHLDLAADVLARWYAEKEGAQDVGRVLPPEYRFFVGDGERNHFSIKWQSTEYWDWSLPDPYKQ